MDRVEYEIFAKHTLDNLSTSHKDIYDNFTFNKIIYWKIVKAHNAPVIKDVNFLNKIIPILKFTWDEVLYYRNNKEKIIYIKKCIDRKAKKVKQNLKYIIYNNFFVSNKLKILDNNVSMMDIRKLYISSNKK